MDENKVVSDILGTMLNSLTGAGNSTREKRDRGTPVLRMRRVGTAFVWRFHKGTPPETAIAFLATNKVAPHIVEAIVAKFTTPVETGENPEFGLQNAALPMLAKLQRRMMQDGVGYKGFIPGLGTIIAHGEGTELVAYARPARVSEVAAASDALVKEVVGNMDLLPQSIV